MQYGAFSLWRSASFPAHFYMCDNVHLHFECWCLRVDAEVPLDGPSPIVALKAPPTNVVIAVVLADGGLFGV